jgi:hypothetical protein
MKYRFEIHDNDEIYTLQTDHYDSIERFHNAVLADKRDGPAFDDEFWIKTSMEIPADYRPLSWDDMQQRNQANAQPLEDAATPNVRADDEGWVEHVGIDCPVKYGFVDTLWSDGDVLINRNPISMSWDKTKYKGLSYITHYRLHKGD